MKIAVSATSFSKNTELRQRAQAAFSDHELIFCVPDIELSPKQLANFLTGAQIAIVGKEKIDGELLNKLPNLRAISKYGVGLDNLDFGAIKTHRVSWHHRPGVNKDAVAELTLGLILSVLRKIGISDRNIHEGKWVKDGGISLTGKTVAIIGCGHCGESVAHILHAFSCRLILVDIRDISALAHSVNGTILNLDAALKEADVITLHVPLTDLTTKLISAKEFSRMKPSAVLINTCRGPVVDEIALIEALKTRRIYGAGFDVFQLEPLDNKELSSLDNLVATAHIAGNSKESVLAMGEAAINGVLNFLDSQM